MKTLMSFIGLMLLIIMAILMAILLGDRGAWYFAWLLGTVVIVLVAAVGGVLLDAQQTAADGLAPDDA